MNHASKDNFLYTQWLILTQKRFMRIEEKLAWVVLEKKVTFLINLPQGWVVFGAHEVYNTKP